MGHFNYYSSWRTVTFLSKQDPICFNLGSLDERDEQITCIYFFLVSGFDESN